MSSLLPSAMRLRKIAAAVTVREGRKPRLYNPKKEDVRGANFTTSLAEECCFTTCNPRFVNLETEKMS